MSRTIACYSVLILLHSATFVFSIININILPIWYDETITLLELAGNASPNWPGGIQSASVHKRIFEDWAQWREIIPILYESDIHPPLYYFSALAWAHLFGKTLVEIRLLSAICIALSGILVGYAVRRMGYIAMISSATLFLFAPMSQWAAVNARDYALAVLLSTATLVLCLTQIQVSKTEIRLSSRRSAIALMATGVIVALAFYSHYFSILITLPMFFLLLLSRLRHMPYAVFASAALCAAMIAAVGPLVLEQMGARPHQFAGFQDLRIEVAAVVRLFLAALAQQPDSSWYGRIQFAGYALIIVGSRLLLARDERSRQSSFFFAFSLFAFFLLILGLFYLTDKSLAHKFGTSRYVMFIIPVVAVLIGSGLGSMARKWPLAAWSLFGILLIPIATTWSDARIPYQPWVNWDRLSPVISDLSRTAPEDSLVVVPRGYGRGLPGTWVHELDPDTKMVIAATHSDFEVALEHVIDVQKVVLVRDPSGRLSASVSEFANALRGLGFTTDNGQLFLR